MFDKQHMNLDAYVDRTKNGPCFICELIKDNHKFAHHVVFRDSKTIAFLNKYPPLFGYVLVAPITHKINVTSDFQLDEYLDIQRFIYRLSEAIRHVVPTERMYILSLGSHQGNSHVHWHIAPLPPGVPHAEQQYEALMLENGILNISEAAMENLAAQIRKELSDGNAKN